MNYNFKQMNLSDLLTACLKCETKEEARELLEQYEKYCDTPELARRHIGHIIGYCESENRVKLYKIFPVNHPVLGSDFGRGKIITPEESLESKRNFKI